MRDLKPHLHDGVHVFASVPPGTPVDAPVVAAIEEAEGRTVVLREEDARRLGLAAQYPSARITLTAATALSDVGVLAGVTAALARAGISVNPFAGVHHDHLFVPHEQAAAAMAVLQGGGSRRTAAGDFETDDDPARIDRDVVWGYLSTEAYWGRSRVRADVEAQLDSAWKVVGAYRRGTGEMVGFARAVGDGVSFAYLADVFVLSSARGAGLGKALVAAMIDDGPPLMRWTLFTDDAHGLYARFGFVATDATAMVRPPQV
ncbi:ACT domain-containing protein [Pseudonocardia sp. CA-107938]|uniref:ACT domain-containing protein n=1 Tax=Pseudonocardia sp. CA-107938 TaxID=3240021 RepID=UPI003D8C839B